VNFATRIALASPFFTFCGTADKRLGSYASANAHDFRALARRRERTRMLARRIQKESCGRSKSPTFSGVCFGSGSEETTLVIQWEAAPKVTVQPQRDPWAESRQAETRQGMLTLKRVIMAKLAVAGVELPGEPAVRGIDQEIVRAAFHEQTPADGSAKEERDFRNARFKRAVSRAIEKELIAQREVGDTTYLWLLPRQPEQPDLDNEEF
jgi:hypothetical protein